MTFVSLAANRYSLRNFATKKVEKEKINYMLQAAQLAPSAVNKQPWKFIAVTQPAMLAKLHTCYPRDWFKTAQACIVVVGNHEESWKRLDGKDHCDIDIAIAVDHMALAATEQGLGSCWVCNFDLEKCRQLFNFASHLEPIVLLPFGYPANEAVPEKKRKELDEIVTWYE